MAEWIIEVKDGKFPIGKWTELVRCKDCKWYTPYKNIQGEEMDEGECEGFNPCVPADHYCSRGKRKESEDDIETLEAWNLDGSPTRYIKAQKGGGENGI